MNKSKLSKNPKDNPIQYKIIIDNCSHSKSLGIDFKELKNSLSDLTTEVIVSKSICKSPIQLSEIIKDSDSKYIIIIGYGNQEHIKKYREVDLSHIPPSFIHVVDLRLFDLSKNNYDALKLNVEINALKVIHSLDISLERIHKPFKLSETVSRRNLFRAATASLEEYSDVPSYQSRFCLPYLDSCTHCLDACPYDAVTKEKNGITIIDKSCVRCGACCSDCPCGFTSPALAFPQMWHL